MKIFHILLVVALNAIPALGWFVAEWTPATTLAVYWFENVAAAVFIASRIVIHRSRRRVAGHVRYVAPGNKPSTPGSYLQGFLIPSLVFSGAHGFFLAILAFVFRQKVGADFVFNWHDIKIGCAMTVGLLLLDFLMDLPGLSQRPFRWIEEMGQRNLGRVVVVHLTIVLGMFAMAFFEKDKGFFGVFIGLKTLMDVSWMLPQWKPKTPPAWLCRIMKRLPSDPKYKDMSFEEFWKKDDQEEIDRQERHERPVRGGEKA